MEFDDGLPDYRAHLQELCRRYDTALNQCGFDGVVIASGRPQSYFMDDQAVAYRPHPEFMRWAPLREHPGSLIFYAPGRSPVLLAHVPVDFWHSIPPLPPQLALAGLEIMEMADAAAMTIWLSEVTGHLAFIGATDTAAGSHGIAAVNPPALVTVLHDSRTRKTQWEVDCIRHASSVAVAGHRAAHACFNAGGSEYEIQAAYRSACQVTDSEMPYPAIVALNEHAATLHYQRLERQRTANRSLLIDAGHAIHGYACDITRTHSDDGCFGALLAAMDELQQELCAHALPGVDYRQLHQAAHHGIARILRDAGLVNADPEAAVASGLTRSFFPHGLGHYLGLQVHDVGALYTRRQPGEVTPAGEDPVLRLTRCLEPGNVLTIEPGLYFIEPLLQKLAANAAGRLVNWKQVDELRTFGGIRIEDNLHITATGNENLTRQAFAATL